jgi:hypothetical protein
MARSRKEASAPLTTAQRLGSLIKSARDIMRKDKGLNGGLGRLRKTPKGFFDQYGPETRTILHEMLEKYAAHGTREFSVPDVLEVPPISQHGNVVEIAAKFGGAEKLIEAVNQLQRLLYAA